MNISNVSTNIASRGSDVTKGLILVLWYASLALAVAVAYEGKAADTVSALYRQISENSVSILFGLVNEDKNRVAAHQDSVVITSPLDYLTFKYDSSYPTNLMIILLNKIVPDWSKKDLFSDESAGENQDNDTGEESLDASIQKKYYILFITIEAHIKTIIDDPDFDINNPFYPADLVPKDFYFFAGSNAISLPGSIQTWLLQERQIAENTRSKRHLADTFLILIILGTFGSLIFLTKDYISNDDRKNTNIASYLFRPLFGMALAMAMFIVDMVAHSVISTGGVENIRNETMYLLGLSSGLLAEKAYELLRRKADDTLDKNGKDDNGHHEAA